MENITEYLIGGIIAGTAILIKLIAAEYFTSIIKEFFKFKKKEQAANLFNIILFLLFLVGLSFILMTYFNPKDAELKTSENIEASNPKTDAEIALEAGKVVLDEVQKGVENIKERNEEIIAKRKKRFVYQIGDITDNEESILKLYEELIKNTEIDSSKIFVFRIKRKKYFLYFEEAYNEDPINEDSLTHFKSKIENTEPVVKDIDLKKYCKAKETIIQRKPLKFRKQKIEIPCLECD